MTGLVLKVTMYYMSHSLNSLKGGYIGDYIGVIKGDTRSLDNGSYIYIYRLWYLNSSSLAATQITQRLCTKSQVETMDP